MRRHLLQFGKMEQQKDTEGFPVVDFSGQPIKSFNVFKSAYGEANQVYGDQKYLAMQQYNSEIIKFKIHYITGLTPDMIIKFKNEFYEMVGPPDNIKHLNQELMIEAKRVIL